jgi:hypothetical protein
MTTSAFTLGTPRRAPSIAVPLVLIALGIVFLLANAGYLTGVSWRHVAQLWPVLLVIGGVDLLLRPRSMAAALVAELAIIAASVAYLVTAPALPGPSGGSVGPFTSQQSIAREGAPRLSLTLGYGGGALRIAGGANDLLTLKSTHEDIQVRRVTRGGASASVDVRSAIAGLPFGGSERAWEVAAPSDIPVGMTLYLGAGDFDVDLSDVMLTNATIHIGASDLTLALPKPTGNVPVTISTGASSVELHIPAGVAYRVRVTGGVNSIAGVQESADYASASDRLSITISAGASSITIR